jgi:glycosyltransferase involved in cell wall biosynthesis
VTRLTDEPLVLAYTDAPVWGGAEESLAWLLSELDRRYRVAVVATDADVLGRLVARRPDAQGRLVQPFAGKGDFRSMRAHVQAFRRLRADICHVNMRTPYSCQAGILAASLAPRRRVVVVEHLPLPTADALVRWSRHHAARLYAAHVAVGTEAARAIEAELRLERGSIRTIHNGVGPHVHRDPPEPGHSPVIGTVGRLVEQKGHEILIEALERLPGVDAVVVGDGPLRSGLEQLAREAGVGDRFRLVGWSDDARGYLSGFDVFVLPSRFEGLPLVVLEAMLAGVPVVASDVGSVSEAIEHERSGLLVPPGDPVALAATVRRLLDDRELALELAASAKAVAAESFTAEAMAAKYDRLYQEILT